MAKRLFTSESVTEGHPDKICDQISDAILDAIMEKDPNGRVACETCVSTGLIHIMGEITTHCYVDIPKIARQVVLDIGYELKMRGAKNIFTCATFPLFTAGLDKFDKAYNDGIIKAVLGTNLTYRKPELLERPWYFDVDLSKYTAYFIAAINHDMSVSSIIDPMTKIKHLLDNHGIPIGNQE